jgi:cytidylate kinase
VKSITGSLVVAIDGPSGVGKGTVARAIARSLQWRYIDTGAMYRAVAWKTQYEGRSLDDEDGIVVVAKNAEFEMRDRWISIDGHDVTSVIRTPEIDNAATVVARIAQVRALLVARQRGYAEVGPLVMEGRDIGTVVFPDAAVKIYLDATPEERAVRRSKDPSHGLSKVGEIEVVANALERRDRLDRTRHASPLTTASDAKVIDTTGVSIDSVVSRVLKIVNKQINNG